MVAVFLELIERYGAPASTLTDNGSVYTSRFTGGRNAFEYVLPLLGVRQKNGSQATPKPRARSSGSSRPCSAGSPPDRRPPVPPSSRFSRYVSQRAIVFTSIATAATDRGGRSNALLAGCR